MQCDWVHGKIAKQKVLKSAVAFVAESAMKTCISVLTFSTNDHTYPLINISHWKSANISPVIIQVCLSQKIYAEAHFPCYKIEKAAA